MTPREQFKSVVYAQQCKFRCFSNRARVLPRCACLAPRTEQNLVESYPWVHWDQLLLKNCFDISYGSGAICYLVLVNFEGGVGVHFPFLGQHPNPAYVQPAVISKPLWLLAVFYELPKKKVVILGCMERKMDLQNRTKYLS